MKLPTMYTMMAGVPRLVIQTESICETTAAHISISVGKGTYMCTYTINVDYIP